MDITFKTAKLEKTFNSEKMLIREYGAENARYIMRRMSVLRAAPVLAEVPNRNPERCHELKGNRKGQFAVDIKDPFRIVFIPNHDSLPLRDDGGIDLARVTAITILDVEDYH